MSAALKIDSSYQERKAVADEIFTVDFAKLPGADPRADGEALQNTWETLSESYQETFNQPPTANPVLMSKWAKWNTEVQSAQPIPEAAISPKERFNGTRPTLDAKELAAIRVKLMPSDEQVLRGGGLRLVATIGRAGSAKSTTLKNALGGDIKASGYFLSDPDEGILENHGAYMFLREVARTTCIAKQGNISHLPIERQLELRNEWRLPPYNAFRVASIVANTMLTKEAVIDGRDIAFGWTGIKGYGLYLIQKGYLAAGYGVDYHGTIASNQTALELETKRARPATPEDFRSKTCDSLLALPDTLACALSATFVLVQTNLPSRMGVTMKRNRLDQPFRITAAHSDTLDHMRHLIATDYVACAAEPNREAVRGMAGRFTLSGLLTLAKV